jgi:Mn-dependent DtxR family transcriptional regulator
VHRLIKQYLSVVSYASLTQIEHVLGVPRVEVQEAATRLQGEGAVDIGASIDRLPGRWLVWRA